MKSKAFAEDQSDYTTTDTLLLMRAQGHHKHNSSTQTDEDDIIDTDEDRAKMANYLRIMRARVQSEENVAFVAPHKPE